MTVTDLLTGGLSFVFTLLIFSYLLGDNPLFRIGTYIFIGVASGYVAAVAMWQVIYPRLLHPLVFGTLVDKGLILIPLLLTGLLLMKAWPPVSHIGTPAVAYLAGVTAAVTVGGGVLGTLFPQTIATINAYDLSRYPSFIEGLGSGSMILLGTVTTLAYFHFSARTAPDGTVSRFAPLEIVAWVGRIFIAITLGALFAGVLIASLTAFVERISSLWNFIGSF